VRGPPGGGIRLLALASDNGHCVRHALLQFLHARPNIEHTEALVTLAADSWTPDNHYPEEFKRCPIARTAAGILREIPTISSVHAKRIADIAIATGDDQVALTLFEALMRSGLSESRRRVLSVALQTGSPPYDRLAAEALVRQAGHADTSLLAQIPSEQLLRRAPAIAVPLTRLMGLRAVPDQVRSVATALAADTERRALLVPLYLSATERGSLPQDVIQLLPDELAERLKIAARGGEKLPPDALDTLGEVGIVEKIISNYPHVFVF
jgi:hypothetical protein